MPEHLLHEAVKEKSATVLPTDNAVPLESILCTGELKRRPSRPPDYETESRALSALAQALADSPRTILQTLADTILKIFKTGSAGMSLLAKDGKSFYWAAIAGAWRPHLDGGTPRDFGPCGDVLDRGRPLLFKHWERRYPYLLEATPLAEEGLLIPFYAAGKAVGTIWAIAHDDHRKFDAEDLRQLESLGRFASAAYRAAATVEISDQRRAALNLMEDAVQSRQAVEALNSELRESEERYRTLFDLGPVAVYSCDAAGVIQNFNRRARELWGREPALGDTDERFCGSHKLFRPDGSFMPHDQCPMAEVLSGKIPEARDAEVLIERPDGSRVTVVVNIRPLKNERGEVTGGINCFYDISERKQAESELRESEERFRTLFTSAPMAVFVCDRKAVIQNYNRRAVELWGREPVCGVEKHCGSVKLWLPNGERLPHEKSPVTEVLRTGVPALNIEVFIERPDGFRVPVLVNFAPLKNAEGEVTGAVTTFIDITERSQAEAELRESERRLHNIIDAFPMAVYTTDAEGLLTHFNPAAVELVGRTPVLGKDEWCVTWKLFHPDGTPMPHSECPMAIALKEDRDVPPQQIVAERPDGTRIWVEVYPTRLRGAEGRTTGGVNVLLDVTERRRAEAALIKSEKLAAAGRLAATLAHEINNPLQAVTNLTDILRRSSKIDAEDRVYADMAAEELGRITHLTRQSLSFYRETTSPVAIDMEDMLAGILNLYAKQIEAKKIVVTTQYESTGTRIDSYPSAIRQVLSTLLVNAMEAVEDGGTIAIRVRKSFHGGDLAVRGIRVTMADNGGGITPANLSRIFEPFFTTKGERGTGLGLWVAQGIMNELGGTIGVRGSIHPARSGTCLSIFIPSHAPKQF